MKNLSEHNEFEEELFDFNISSFEEKALETFHFQYRANPVYRQFADLTGVNPALVKNLTKIPFLPISFFKSHEVVAGDFEPEIYFESSGTTQTGNSKHFVKSLAVYRRSFLAAFELFYGNPNEWCILALLPSYLERGHSSLVVMADELIRLSGHSSSGFYLDQFESLHQTLLTLEKQGQKTILIGVTFALLDFAAIFPMQLKHTIVMETGGMKGRKKEMTRTEVHAILKDHLGVTEVHSEYGMTELLSQAYAPGDGIFITPPWMKVLLRAEDDPFLLQDNMGRNLDAGLINIIDLANRYSCSFIATDDLGLMHSDGRFEVIGRLDNSDIRGCSLMSRIPGI